VNLYPGKPHICQDRRFVRYKRRGGTKKRILADFLIGAHATVAKMKIISRDAGYSRYFTVEVLNPAAKGK